MIAVDVQLPTNPDMGDVMSITMPAMETKIHLIQRQCAIPEHRTLPALPPDRLCPYPFPENHIESAGFTPHSPWNPHNSPDMTFPAVQNWIVPSKHSHSAPLDETWFTAGRQCRSWSSPDELEQTQRVASLVTKSGFTGIQIVDVAVDTRNSVKNLSDSDNNHGNVFHAGELCGYFMDFESIWISQQSDKYGRLRPKPTRPPQSMEPGL